MRQLLMSVEIRFEQDLLLARRRARQIAQVLGYASHDQVRMATALSELVRNVFQYTPGGRVDFAIDAETPARFIICVSDRGKGIKQLDDILEGTYVSKTGMGIGLSGARRLVDRFSIESDEQGTRIELGCDLPKRSFEVTKARVDKIIETLSAEEPQNPFEEMQRQNQDLLAALAEVQAQQLKLTALNLELEETNRGVVALSGELEQRADYQKRASDLKTEFLSTITHELRTPLNSIISISSILIDRLDGDLTDEQEKQVEFIRQSARELSTMVNDVLDLAKVEAGKIVIRPRHFEVSEMFRVLRGMLKPLIQPSRAVELIFEDNAQTQLIGDEGKISQIMRNFISNALKYTHTGEIRVSAKCLDDDWVEFSVADTGIGIALEDQDRIFDDFTQIEGDHQISIKGTGLGLPLSKKLADMLGGQIAMSSVPGEGSTFSLLLPRIYNGSEEVDVDVARAQVASSRPDKVLIIDDHTPDRYVLRRVIEKHAGTIFEATNGKDGIALAVSTQPTLIFLDLGLPDIDGSDVLVELKQNAVTSRIPVVINSSSPLAAKDLSQRLLGATALLSKSQPHSDRVRKIAEIFSHVEVQRRSQS